MRRTNESFFRRILPAICLALCTSCSQELSDGPEDRFKKLVDISRDEAALKEYLKPVPPTEPADALKTFETADGFQMQLVAHEPMVNEPVAATSDENGRMYVAELKSYPYQPGEDEEPTGRVRLLEDKDGDGVFDVSHVFADGLIWPTGVAVFKGGVYVSAPPSIFYLKDTDGDGQADIRKVIYTGFGVTNEQQMVNNLIWGVDHKIYASTGGDGGYIRPGDQPNAEPISVYDRDFRFDPVSGAFELTTQTFQFGHSFDEWYNRFVCTAGSSGRHVVMPGGYLERNPYLFFDLHGFHWEGHGSLEVNPLVQGSTRVYKISPIERWRTIREARRVFAGRSNRSAGVGHSYQTAGAGVQVYRGHAYPEKYRGSIFIGANTANLYHRRVLEEDGVTFKSVRGEPEETEFVRSTDNWFRPVNSINAPDGTMYILDMYRELIEAAHVPARVMKHLDFTRGQDRGRIYRVAPPGFDSAEIPSLLLESWESQTPEVRNKVLTGLLSREHWTRSLLSAIEGEELSSSQIDPKRRELLMNHSDEAIRARAVTLFDSQAPGPRQAVLADYQAALTLTGDSTRGETVYRRECVKCHRLSSTEHLIGPNLIMGSFKDPEPLLTSILDPNRFVEPQFLQYVVTDKKRRLFTGILTDQTATSVTLLEGEDLQNTVLREDILEMRATGKSLMPEGLEENVNHQEMADLLKFILDYQYVIGTESAGYGPGDEVFEPLATRRWGTDDRNRP